MVEFIMENFAVIVGLVCVVVYCGLNIYNYIQLNSGNKEAVIRKTIFNLVSKAEEELGSGLGEMKLEQVHREFIGKYPVLSKFITEEQFKQLVDDALEDLKLKLQ